MIKSIKSFLSRKTHNVNTARVFNKFKVFRIELKKSFGEHDERECR